MGGLIPKSFINDLLARLDIVEIVSSRVRLKKSGVNFLGLCPFHQEKTPSFSVSPTKQFYHCFGCGESGDAISFVMKFDRMEFSDAVEMLAGKLGLDVPYAVNHSESAKAAKSQFDELYTVLNKSALFFREQLKKTPRASNYAKLRGINEIISERYLVGFSPGMHNELISYFRTDPDAKSKLLKVGLLTTGVGNDLYERFRDRLIFPIRDRRGRVIAFGGRILGDGQPKYLNSPETVVFHKGEELYGLYEARKALPKIDRLLVVEGYMDVVALAQFGIDYAIASMGTAITLKQIQKALRECNEIIFCFDGDTAGKKAAWRALEILLPIMREGFKIKFVFLPGEDDPDSFLRTYGRDKFLELLENADTFSQYLFKEVVKGSDLNTIDGRAFVTKKAMDLIGRMSPGVFREMMTNELAKKVQLDVKNFISSSFSKSSSVLPSGQKNISSKVSGLVLNAIGAILQRPELIEELDVSDLANFDVPHLDLFFELIELFKVQQNFSIGAILQHYRGSPHCEIIASLASRELLLNSDALKKELLGSLSRLREQIQEDRMGFLLAKAKQGQLSDDERIILQSLLEQKKNRK